VTDKWNMLAPSSFVILTSRVFALDSTTFASHFYGYFGGNVGYKLVDTLLPGHAYWIKVRKAGRLAIMPGLPLASPGGEHLSAGSATASVASLLSETNKLEVEDASGSIRSLYFSEGNSQIDGKMFEAPPKAPSPEIMDVRFSTGRILETARPESQREIPVHIESGSYPLTLSMKVVEPGSHATLYVDDRQVAVTPGGVIQIANPKSSIKLVFDAASEQPLPTVFALRQNYPNPFNPSTTIRYDLPVRSMVTLKLYNVLGQVVKTLVERIEDAGFRSVDWDAAGYASGVYFYRLEARGIEGGREIIVSRKMILMR
jgi:hypothetical protein